jgi:hypothetical protein
LEHSKVLSQKKPMSLDSNKIMQQKTLMAMVLNTMLVDG